MDILAPDANNFNLLTQVDINISPYITSMKQILTNSLTQLITDSFDHAVEIHSQLPHLHFPFAQWSAFKKLESDQILKVFKNIPPNNYPQLINDCVNVIAVKPFKENDTIYNRFIIATLLSSEAKNIMNSKRENYSQFELPRSKERGFS